jgi:CHAT domain-containing protein/tetratricopeptide (TPR) repeat protein
MRCSPERSEVPTKIVALSARAGQALTHSVDPDLTQAVALADIVWADSVGTSLDRSLSLLEAAAPIARNPAPMLADLSAVHLLRFDRSRSTLDALRSLEYAQRALEHDPSQRGARFNLLVGAAQLQLSQQVKRIEREFSGDPSAHRRVLELLQRVPIGESATPLDTSLALMTVAGLRQLAQEQPQRAREFGWQRALADWARATLDRDAPSARSSLASAQTLGEVLSQQGADGSLDEAVQEIKGASTNAPLIARLANAHQQFAKGYTAYLEARYDASLHSMDAVVRAAPNGSPLRGWAALHAAIARTSTFHATQAERALRDLIAMTDSMRRPALAARARWSLGSVLLRNRRHDEGMRWLAAAEALFSRIGERENTGAVQSIQAEETYDAASVDTAFTLMQRALETLRPFRESLWFHNHLLVMARAAQAEGLLRAAELIEEEDVAVSRMAGSAINRTEARLALARILALRGNSSASTTLFRQLLSEVGSLESAQARQFLGAELQVNLATLGATAHSTADGVLLDASLAYFDSLGNRAHAIPILLARADTRLARNASGAMADLARASALLGGHASTLPEAETRAAYVERMRTVFERLLTLRLGTGDTTGALAALEQGRVSLAGWPRSSAATADGAGPNGATLDLALVGDTLLAWYRAKASTRWHFVRRVLPRARFVQDVLELRTLLARGASEPAVVPRLAALYESLLRPVAGYLDGDSTMLTIVADADLAAVPFAALRDSSCGCFLVERRPLRLSSSLEDAGRRRAAYPRTPVALLVADPALDARAFPGVPRLPHARAEVGTIAGLFVQPIMMSDTQATVTAVRYALSRASTMHFAGHAFFDERHPQRSMLALAPFAGHEGRLTAATIVTLNLSRVELVVLAACETARGGEGRAGFVSSMAGAFLKAGAGGVVGTLWRVEDEAEYRLMIAFHQAWHESRDAAAALRIAQLNFLRSGDPALRSPAAWAAFQFTGR